MQTIIKSLEKERNDFNLNVPKIMLNYLGKYDYTIDDLIVVYCLQTNRKDHIIYYLAGRGELQKLVLFNKYERKGLIKKVITLDEFDVDNYELTQAGLELLSNCRSYFSSIEEMVECLNQPLTNGDFEELVSLFINTFPEKSRNKAGEVLRSNKIDVTKKMRAFIAKYDYSKDEIIGATRNYIEVQSQTRFEYCSGAHYFVMKDNISKLANECENFRQNGNSADELGSFTQQLM